MSGDVSPVFLSIVATKLAGRAVHVRFKDPGSRRLGRCYRWGKAAVIELRPGMQESEALTVFLHEAAHARHDHGRMWDWLDGAPPATIPDDGAPADRGYTRRESRAEIQAKQWGELAAKYASSFQGKLAALLIYD